MQALQNKAILFFIALVVAVAVGDDSSTTSQALIRFFTQQFKDLVGISSSDSSSSSSSSGDLVDHAQPLLVINAGNGRTGTASFVLAMERLGLKCYHMKEGVIETPGHIDLWSKFVADKTITIDAVLDDMARSGFNATADAPINFYYKEQMERYPNAPVILSIRPEQDNPGLAWQSSMRESVLNFPIILNSIPFRWIPTMKRFKNFLDAMNRQFILGDQDLHHGLFETDAMAKFYDDWNAQVIQHVPAEKLLIFKAQDGWKPLCDHISHVSPVVAANCREILESGEPFPRVNDRASVQRTQFGMRCVTKVTYILVFLLALLLVRMLSRNSKTTFKGKAD